MQVTLRRHGAKWLGAGLLAVLLAMTGGCLEDDASPAAGTPDAIKARGVLRVAVYADKPPFGYVDSEGRNQGYDVELARRLAKDLLGDESRVDFVATEAQKRVDLLNSGTVDIMLANFTRTAERAKLVDFSLPYMKTSIGVASLKASPLARIEDLHGKRLAVVKGTTADLYFTQQGHGVELQRFDNNTEAFNALKSGAVAGASQDSALLYAWIKANPNYAVALDQLGANDVIAPAVKKGNTALLSWLDGEIRQLYAERFFYEDYDKSLRPFYSDDIDPANIVISGE